MLNKESNSTGCVDTVKPFSMVENLERERDSLITQLDRVNKRIKFIKHNPEVEEYFKMP